MTYSQALFLAVVQGITEFLPISSSGHLVIFQHLFGLTRPPVLYDILVHLGTLGAILIYFRKEIIHLVVGIRKKDKLALGLFFQIIAGTIPAAVVGLYLQNYIDQIFDSLRLVSLSLLFTSGLLLASRYVSVSNKIRFGHLKFLDSLFIGLFQALAILPGISRSGSTIVAGLWRRLDREAAFLFSFYLAVPAIIGAAVLQLPALFAQEFNYLNQSFIGMLIAGIFGYLTLAFLKNVLIQSRLWVFGFYCLGLALFLLFIA